MTFGEIRWGLALIGCGSLLGLMWGLVTYKEEELG